MVTSSQRRGKSNVLKLYKVGLIMVFRGQTDMRAYGLKPLEFKSKVKHDVMAVVRL